MLIYVFNNKFRFSYIINVTYTFKTSDVNYEIVGQGANCLVFLHGWGGEINSFKFICKYLNFDFKALFIDFPPFGKSTEMQSSWTIFDYAELTLNIMRLENIEKPIIIGHSFGGRVATLLASKGHAKKLLLVDSAGLKPKRSLNYRLKVMCNKIKRAFGCKNIKGSKDYNELSPIMKKTFVNIVSTFLDEYAININVPTIIFWGKKDKDTPIYMAKRFKKLIKNSELIVVKQAGHFSYLDNLNLFVEIINYMAK